MARRQPAFKVSVSNQIALTRLVINRITKSIGHVQSSYLYRRVTTSLATLSAERKSTISINAAGNPMAHRPFFERLQ
ncbi:MAG: hypothetical protein ACI814_001203, partial [Mariniblastus sp.]